MCLLTNERYNTYKMGFLSGHLGHAPGVGLVGAGGQKFNFMNMDISKDLGQFPIQSAQILTACG